MTKTFRDLSVDNTLCEALDARGITHPFPIQELTLPLALDGNDLIGQARTGTGKTLAFGLPLLQRIDPTRKQTQALVIAPTRELANQVHEDLSIGAARGLTSIVVYGGTPYEEQIEALQGGAHVVVGTPGRLLDHLNRGNLDLSQVTELVLDEADEMLDMGFLPDVERLIEACQGEDRHTMLFSATMPTAIVRLARRYMVHPTFTRADHEEKHTAPLVTQHFFQVHRMDKPRVLARILQAPNRGGVYVFVRTKHMADRLVNELEDLGTPAIPIHGDLRQTSREKNLERFRSGKATVLVATEVAARGLDVSGVTHVVNYDCPDDEKMYLHRIGRTARAGEAGVAVTFAEFNEADRLNVIRKKVGATDTEVLPIFSTSPELAELFDLPEDKPWDAQVRGSVAGTRTDRRDKGRARSDGRSKNRRDQEGKGDGSRSRGGRQDDRSGSSSKDRSDGRAKGDRSSSSRGGRSGGRSDDGPKSEASSSSRAAQPKGGSRSRTRDEQAPATERSSEGGDRSRDRDRDTSGGGERTRTRTRTRQRNTEDTSRDRPARSGDGSPRPEDRQGRSGDGERGGRTRARGGARPATARSDRSQRTGGDEQGRGGQERDQDRGKDRSGDQQDRGDRNQRDRSKGRGGSGSGGGQGRRSGGRNSGGDGRSGGGGGRSGGRGGNKGGNKGSGNNGRSGKGRSSQDRDDERTVSYARRGEEARGEGHPQLARRVKVEKLP